jgi:RimJ/RimL family protein N-acetyltransferase
MADPVPPPWLSQPAFETGRLALRPRTPAADEACFALDGDPEVTRFVPRPWSDEAGHRAFIAARTRGPYPPGLGYWTITDRTDGLAFLGWVLLIPSDAVGPEIEIGWRLARAAWGRGYATEAARPLLRHAFAGLGLDEVIAEVLPGNQASIGVAAKLGLRAEGQSPTAPPYLRFAMRLAEFQALAAVGRL